jgi:hypothetical protein
MPPTTSPHRWSAKAFTPTRMAGADALFRVGLQVA